MPYRKQRGIVARRTRRVHRGGAWYKKLFKLGKSANKFLRKTKLISKGAQFAANQGMPYAGQIARVSKQLGYGKRRKVMMRRKYKKRGRGLKLAGAGLGTAGSGKKKRMIPRPITF